MFCSRGMNLFGVLFGRPGSAHWTLELAYIGSRFMQGLPLESEAGIYRVEVWAAHWSLELAYLEYIGLWSSSSSTKTLANSACSQAGACST